jgi:antitoxin component YwqK of YwqJK toxin-antitoxin module
VNFKEGNPEGILKAWHENGQLKTEKNYKNNMIISEKCWDTLGKEIICQNK